MNRSPKTDNVLALVLLIGASLLAACEAPPSSGADRMPAATAGTAADASASTRRAAQQADSLAERLIAHADSAFGRVEPLSAREKSRLRRYLQDEHLAVARRLGIDPVRDRRVAARLMSRPPEESGVVHLRTDDFYVVDPRMGYAVPLVVPPAAHLLEHIGRRFQQDLLARGLPPYRFILTNVLRTGIDQAHLRGTNVNAAQGRSTHEYGTTFDIYYGRFHYAAAHDTLARRLSPAAELDAAHLRQRLREAYRRFGDTYAPEIRAVLGRALLQMQDEGLLLATYERQQPVFHLTVAGAVLAPPPAYGLPDAAPEMTAAMRRFYANVESQLTDIENDVEELEEQTEEATGEARRHLAGSLPELRAALGALWQELGEIDGLPASAFPEMKSGLQRRVAELEGQLERTEIEAMQRKQEVQSRLRARIRDMERAISGLEALVVNADADMRARYEQQVSDLRSRHTELQSLLQELPGASGAEFEEMRSQVADAVARLTADLHTISAGMAEARVQGE